ncbi:hypothetical protein [Flavobacterium sp.]
MNIPSCKLNFRQFSGSGLDTFTQLVLAGIYPNATQFLAPPINLSAYTATRNLFVSSFVEYDKYGSVKKTEYIIAKKEMVISLNTLAVYVDSVAMGDASKIILSGFAPSREQPQPSQPLPKVENFSVKRSDNDGEIVVTIGALSNYGMINYGCICVEGRPLDENSIVNGQLVVPEGTQKIRYDMNKSRTKKFNNLTIGTLYFFYCYAINSVSVSPLSGVRQLMAA